MAPAAHPPLTPFGSALAGALGSVFANAAVYPLDTIKTRLQAEDDDNDDDTNDTDLKDIKRWDMLMMLLKILKKEGISGAFHGFGASMIGTFSQQFAYFFFHTLLRTSYLRRLSSASRIPSSSPSKSNPISPPSISTPAELLLGALAGALAQIFTIPVQVIATRQQLWQPDPISHAPGSSAPSLLETANEIISESGITGLWTGLKPGLVLTFNPAITYGVFERLKSYRLSKRSALSRDHSGSTAGKLGVGEAFVLGVISKMLATVVTYPYIFAKVRLQAKASPEEVQYDTEHSSPSTSAQRETHIGEDTNQGSSTTEVEADKTAQPDSQDKVTPSYASIASATPAFGSATIDLPKNQDQNESAEKTVRPGLNKKRGQSHKYHHHHKHALSLLQAVYAEHGFKGWYKGLTAQIVKAVLCQGILFVSKDQFESYAWILLVGLTTLRRRLRLSSV
uniref:Adenine nucleotide transporter n=1 Tax=Kwoniella dejecticola CBS 10117 TaxID=1296121 RepID=A0A1A6ABL6_9TREE|nr:uncharacterized protein I303_01667 [Kwoniella dejecticola CBS 10117]OBR87462.1 hypothetical protein I303_01667 [Kwoniella dejecticola CBS 10117]